MKKVIKTNRGFTLVELLAVIVILGLLMAIAIPSVTKYITASRVKTLVSTMDSYVTAVVTQVNDGEYKFSDSTKVYAIPIECISLEKGGTNPFGNWMQANESYWAYVLVHYDNENYNYEYGFTFKDDAGYGLYPTINDKITNNMVKTRYDDLTQPKDGLAKDFVSIDKWEGFTNVTSTTTLEVLEAESEGTPGDGQTTCTLCQKGDNYEQIEQEKENRPQLLTSLIKKHNTLITAQPTLTDSSNNTSDASGLYSSKATNSGNLTYYFRGNVTNNNVEFAGLKWKIIRINEDGTVRLILDGRVGNTTYKFSSAYNNYSYMYYSNSDTAKPTVDNWYKTNITNKGYDSYVSTGTFCEQAKVKSHGFSGDATMEEYTAYTPDFKCTTDGNGKGVINSKVGLITYDEVIYAGGYNKKSNSNFYLYNGSYEIWTMSPSASTSFSAGVWYVYTSSTVYPSDVNFSRSLRPVINLNTGLLATGTGTSADPYVVQTN